MAGAWTNLGDSCEGGLAGGSARRAGQDRAAVGHGDVGQRRHGTAIVFDPVYKDHLTGPGHPESPQRCDAVTEALAVEGLDEQLIRLSPRPALDDELLACHTREYIDLVKGRIASGESTLGFPETNVSGGSLKAALFAAGGVFVAVDAVLAGRAKNAFCIVRPPGHHALPAKGMGFCLFNNVALAARYAQRKHQLDKVLIIDWDVHHGNGTQEIFYEDPSVFYFSTHQWPWYPGTGWNDECGLGKGKGTTLNCPFPAGTRGGPVLDAYREQLLPAAAAFNPQLVLVSAGFDSREGDPLGQLALTSEDFSRMTAAAAEIARRCADGRLVSVLEGGYNLTGLGNAARAHVEALMDAYRP